MAQYAIPTKLSHRLSARMPWLDAVAAKMHAAYEPVLGQDKPRALRDALYGVWLGHPLHPAVILAPTGMWTASLALDVAGQEDAADLTLLLGLLSAGAAVATGAAQWQDTYKQEQPRRIGALHAMLNVTGTVIYGVSYAQRRRGNRASGVALSAAGYAVVSAASWLGGDLSYDLGIGVNRTAFEKAPGEWTDVLAEADLEPKKATRVDAGGAPVMLYQRDGEILAISPTCSHLSGPLDEGEIDGDNVVCPWHKSVFCLRDGAVVHGPATAAQTAYDVRVEGGRILVKAREF